MEELFTKEDITKIDELVFKLHSNRKWYYKSISFGQLYNDICDMCREIHNDTMELVDDGKLSEESFHLIDAHLSIISSLCNYDNDIFSVALLAKQFFSLKIFSKEANNIDNIIDELNANAKKRLNSDVFELSEEYRTLFNRLFAILNVYIDSDKIDRQELKIRQLMMNRESLRNTVFDSDLRMSYQIDDQKKSVVAKILKLCDTVGALVDIENEELNDIIELNRPFNINKKVEFVK